MATFSDSSSKNSSNKKSFLDFKGKSKKGFSDTVVWLIMLIPNLIINLVCFFIRGKGRGLIGLAVFAWGLLISADAYWLAANPTAPSLTQFGTPEGKQVIGVWASLNMLFFGSKGNELWLAIATSTVIQIIEGMAVRGSSPEEAKGNLDYYAQFNAGSAPSGKIKRATAAHNDFMNAGMFQYYLIGFAAIGGWIADIVVTFQSHNPLIYWGDPLTIIGVTLINIVKVFSAETGFAIMLRLNGRG